MKKIAISALVLALGSAYPAFAEEAHHPEQVAAKPVQAPDAEKSVQKLKENARKLQAQTDKITKTRDPKERQKLLAEHMQTLQESMMTAKGMQAGGMNCPMMGGDQGGGGMMGMMHGGQGGGMTCGMPGEMMKRHEMMEKRMDMMQMMLENLMKSQGQPALTK